MGFVPPVRAWVAAGVPAYCRRSHERSGRSRRLPRGDEGEVNVSLGDLVDVVGPSVQCDVKHDLDQLCVVVPGELDCANVVRSEEHTSELQSLTNLVCRLLLEKKKTTRTLKITE